MKSDTLLVIVFSLFLLTLAGCTARTPSDGIKPDVYVTTKGHQGLPGEAAVFTHIQHAVDAAPDNAARWVIQIAPGTYHERVVINRSGVRLIGAGKQVTRITFDRYAGQRVSPDSEKTWGTSGSAVLEINRQDTGLYDLTIENTFDYLANDALPEGHPSKVNGTQAVALRIGENADRTVLQRVELLGFQDTLYIKGGRTFVSDSDISGNIDFVFGGGNALFEKVNLISMPRGQREKSGYAGFVTAPSTLLTNEYGLTFINCRLLRTPGVEAGSVALGRPWHPTTTFSDGRYANPNAIGKATFINTYMDEHIAPEGWTSMPGTGKNGQVKFFDPLSEARFAEWGSYGPGAAINENRPQLSEQALHQYIRLRVLQGWQPHLLYQ